MNKKAKIVLLSLSNLSIIALPIATTLAIKIDEKSSITNAKYHINDLNFNLSDYIKYQQEVLKIIDEEPKIEYNDGQFSWNQNMSSIVSWYSEDTVMDDDGKLNDTEIWAIYTDDYQEENAFKMKIKNYGDSYFEWASGSLINASEKDVLTILNAHDGKDDFLKPQNKLTSLQNGAYNFWGALNIIKENTDVEIVEQFLIDQFGITQQLFNDQVIENSLIQTIVRKIKVQIQRVINSIDLFDKNQTKYTLQSYDMPTPRNDQMKVWIDSRVIPSYPYSIMAYSDMITLDGIYDGEAHYQAITTSNYINPDDLIISLD